jgi:hypothetical protein
VGIANNYTTQVAEYAEDGYERQIQYDSMHSEDSLNDDEGYSQLWLNFLAWRDRGYPVKPECLAIAEKIRTSGEYVW